VWLEVAAHSTVPIQKCTNRLPACRLKTPTTVNKSRTKAIIKLLTDLELKDGRYSTTVGDRENVDTNVVFTPVFKKIASLYDGIDYFAPATGRVLLLTLGEAVKQGKADATIGAEGGLRHSLMEFEFKSGM
jgi:hypothetical protein